MLLVQRLLREGRTRAEIARNVAAGLQGHREELVAKARLKRARRSRAFGTKSRAFRQKQKEKVLKIRCKEVWQSMQREVTKKQRKRRQKQRGPNPTGIVPLKADRRRSLPPHTTATLET